MTTADELAEFKSNVRMSFMISHLNRLDVEEIDEYYKTAEQFIAKVTKQLD